MPSGLSAFPTNKDLRLTSSERTALTYLLSILAHGERIAMEGARLQATIAPTPAARKFLRIQARHELFHAHVFEAASRRLAGCARRSPAMPAELLFWQTRTRNAVLANDFSTSVLVQQVFLEGLGHVLLQHLEREIDGSINCLAGIRRLILSQEDKHRRFGLEMIEQVRRQGSEIACRLLPVSSELFEQAHELLSKLSEPFDILEIDRGDYLAELHTVIPAWLQETH